MSLASRKNLLAILKEGVRELSLDLNDKQCEKLLDYIELLQKWNGVYNLTAVRDPEQMVRQHLLDCLAVIPSFRGVHEVLDVGAGGGLPGIVLAIACPDMQVSLIDTVQKKTAFLTQVKAELGLGNVTVHTGRVEQLKDDKKYEVITSRAFADLSDFIKLANHLLKDNGKFIAMKGAIPQAEIANLPADWRVSNILPLAVPGLQAQRHLITMERGHQ